MATTLPTRIGGIAARSLPVRLLDKYFYFFMSLLVATTVIYGFSHTINDNLFHPTVPRPTLLAFHAACFSAWVAFFIFQSALVRTHNVRIHRLTGWFGAALGAAMIVLGYSIAVIMARFKLHTLHDAFAVPFLIVPLFDITNFAVLFTLAILWRRKPEYHRRLILLATCEITSAAFGRFPFDYPPPLRGPIPELRSQRLFAHCGEDDDSAPPLSPRPPERTDTAQDRRAKRARQMMPAHAPVETHETHRTPALPQGREIDPQLPAEPLPVVRERGTRPGDP